MSNQSSSLTVIPAELKNQLPIFQVLGDRLPAPLKTVKEKIAHVDGVRIDMVQSGVQAQRTAEEKYNFVKRLAAEASKNEEMAAAAMSQNNTEKTNENSRTAKETRTKAFLLGKE